MSDSSISAQPAANAVNSRVRKSLMLSPAQHQQVKRLARQHQVDMIDFVMAAVDYFERSGASPFAPREPSPTEMERNTQQQFEQVRSHHAQIGNALLEVIRNAERGTGRHLQQQQGGIMLYLERIERTLLTYLAQVESRILRPLLEQVLRTDILVHSNHVLLVKMFDESQGEPRTVEQLTKSLDQLEADNEEHYRQYARPILAASVTDKLHASEKPLVATPPPPVPLKTKRTAGADRSARLEDVEEPPA